jgi:hypothetical protein
MSFSFNLGSLIAGTSTTPTIKKKPIESKVTPTSIKKSFTHGVNVIFKQGTYKGYHGYVSEFFPASIRMVTSGKAYIEGQKYGPLVTVGNRIVTEVGYSIIEQVIPSVGGQYVPIQLYKNSDDNQIRVGRVVTNNKMIIQSLTKQGKGFDEIQMMMNNPNNTFIVPVSLFDTSLISNMSGLKISGSDADMLTEQLVNMQLNSQTPTPLEQLSEEVKTNANLLDKIIHPEFFDDIDVRIVFKRDLVGPTYFMDVSNNLGDVKIYNPSKMNYLVSYTKIIPFKPSDVEFKKGDDAFKYAKEFVLGENKEIKMTKRQIEQEKISKVKYFGIIKSSPYKGQRLEMAEYIPAHLSVVLTTNGKTVTSHVVRKQTKNGDLIVDEYGNPVFETKQIVPTDVFYLDVLLKNGNYAQVDKILPTDQISITEKDKRGFSKREILDNEIKEFQPGFKFNEKTVKGVNIQEDIFITPIETPDEQQESYEEETNDSQEFDYAMTPIDGEEQEQKASFKDTQRGYIEQRELSAQEKRFKDEILGVLRVLKVHEDSIDLYSTIDIINGLVKNISRKLKNMNYGANILVTSNIKFIIVCVILYELIKTGFDKDINNVISMLFPSYFTIKDIQPQSMNENIFLMQWDDILTQSRVNDSVNKIKKYLQAENEYQNIIKEIIMNADILLQSMLGISVNIISRTPAKFENLIAVGINPETGRRFKEEEIEKAITKRRAASSRVKEWYVTIDDLLNNLPLPAKEVQIIWTHNNKPILEKFQQELQKKAESQLNTDYIYIKHNLFRAPFALRDDDMKPAVRKAFNSIYKTLLSSIIKQNIKIQKSHKRKREEQENISQNRAKIFANQPSFEDEDEEDNEPQHTRSYIREQAKRETQRAISKATRAANRTAYMMKKQRQDEPKTQEENTEQTSDAWWNSMDTSE